MYIFNTERYGWTSFQPASHNLTPPPFERYYTSKIVSFLRLVKQVAGVVSRDAHRDPVPHQDVVIEKR